jgi:hypothetical protein
VQLVHENLLQCCVIIVLFMLEVYMEVVPKPIIGSDHIKAFLDNPQWPKHIRDPQLQQIQM